MLLSTAWSLYFYPRPPSGGRPQHRFQSQWQLQISIHALRVEGDKDLIRAKLEQIISIHALRVEGDLTYLGISNTSLQFLSTPSEWRATADQS